LNGNNFDELINKLTAIKDDLKEAAHGPLNHEICVHVAEDAVNRLNYIIIDLIEAGRKNKETLNV